MAAVDQEGNDHDTTDPGDPEEELITAEKLLETLENAWMNEMFAPDILPHQSEVIDLIMSQVTHLEESIKDLDKKDLQYRAHHAELNRIRYIISNYLQCRLQKIETYTQHILAEEARLESNEKRLTDMETVFANEHLDNVENLFKAVALQYLPSMQSSDEEQQIIRPNLMEHVFIKANASVPAVIVGADEEEVDLEAGSQHIIPYHLISDLIVKGQVQLI